MSATASAYATYGEAFVLGTAHPRFKLIEGGLSHDAAANTTATHEARQLCPAERLKVWMAAFVVVFALALSWLASDALTRARVQDALDSAGYGLVTVMPGDSLWSIAEEYPVAGCTTSELVHHIREVNHLDDASLKVGMRLSIPMQLL